MIISGQFNWLFQALINTTDWCYKGLSIEHGRQDPYQVGDKERAKWYYCALGYKYEFRLGTKKEEPDNMLFIPVTNETKKPDLFKVVWSMLHLEFDKGTACYSREVSEESFSIYGEVKRQGYLLTFEKSQVVTKGKSRVKLQN